MSSTETTTRRDAVRRGYEAFQTGDMDTMRTLFTDDIVWHAPGGNPLSGDARGIPAVLQRFGELAERSGGTFRVEVLDMLESDAHVVVLGRATASREGRSLDSLYCHIFSFRGAKVSESWVVDYDQAATDAFWE